MSIRKNYTNTARGIRALGPSEEAILASIGRYHYLTAEQVCRLHFSSGSLRYSQTKLKHLADAGFLTRIFLPRREQHGSSPLLYGLATPGRVLLRGRGASLRSRYRPVEEEQHSYLFLEHTLSVNDFLIAAELLARSHPVIALEELRHERDLKREPVYVEVRGEGVVARVGVIPDGWLDLAHIGRNERFCFVVELDRGTTKRRKWQRKVAALLSFAQGPYQRAFGREAITIIVATTEGEKRRDDLLAWTQDELVARWLMHEADLFRFASIAPGALSPEAAFLSPLWYVPFASAPVPLLTIGEGEA